VSRSLAGGADRARPPRRRTALRLAAEIILRGARRTEALLRAIGFSELIGDPEIIGFHISPKAAATSGPLPQSLCLGDGKIRRVVDGLSAAIPIIFVDASDGFSQELNPSYDNRVQLPIAAIASAIAIVRRAMSACSRSTIWPSIWNRAARGVFRPLEGCDDLAGLRDLFRRRGEESRCRHDLARMDQRLAVEAEIARLGAFLPKPSVLLKSL